MALVTAAEAMEHVRADSADVIQPYLDAAIDHAVQFLNRRVFNAPADLATAVAEVPAALAAAQLAYDTSITAAAELVPAARSAAERAACAALRAAQYEADGVYAGIVANPSINAAILLITAHLFTNRESVTATAAQELPQGPHALLWPYRVGLGV